jgi:hypothetical protein
MNGSEIHLRLLQMRLDFPFHVPIKSQRDAAIAGKFARSRIQLYFLVGPYQDRLRLPLGRIRIAHGLPHFLRFHPFLFLRGAYLLRLQKKLYNPCAGVVADLANINQESGNVRNE